MTKISRSRSADQPQYDGVPMLVPPLKYLQLVGTHWAIPVLDSKGKTVH